MTLPRAAALLVVPLMSIALTGCGGGTEKPAAGDANTGSASTSPSGSPTSGGTSGGDVCAYPSDQSSPSRPVKAPPSKPVTHKPTQARISTSAGDITLTLDAAKAPCTVSSFISLAKQGFFDKTVCHRLTTQGILVLQCGDPSGTGSGGPGYTIPDEIIDGDSRLQPCQQSGGTDVCTYGPGTVAMANTGQPGTGGSQFFLVYGSSQLPNTYTVFGRMDAAGLKVVKAVAKAGVSPVNGPGDGSPKKKVEISGVTIG